MKFIKLTTILIILFSFCACSTDNISNEENSVDPNFRVTEGANNLFGRSADEAELTVDLIAGQNYIAGAVTVYASCSEIMIVYSTNTEWSIEATHLSIGNCGSQSIPLTGSGNPKIGKFEHSSEHPGGTNEVTYTIDRDAIEGNDFCFAAHAVVSGTNGVEETAWANGISFDGNSWAMYVEASLSDCENGSYNEIE